MYMQRLLPETQRSRGRNRLTHPWRRTAKVTLAAPCSSEVRAFSVANGPWPKIRTLVCAFQATSRTSLAIPHRTWPTKDTSLATNKSRGAPSRRLVHMIAHVHDTAVRATYCCAAQPSRHVAPSREVIAITSVPGKTLVASPNCSNARRQSCRISW